MGRYSSVQAYTDQQNTRTTSYEQEKSSSSTVKTEKVHNPYGSTAGAGSGEFHVYRHARAREQQRLQALDESEQERVEESEFQTKVQGWKNEEENRLNKKRKKRAREKAAKMRKKNLSLSGVKMGNGVDDNGDRGEDDEFEYTPLHVQKEVVQQHGQAAAHENGIKDDGKCAASSDVVKKATADSIKKGENDGTNVAPTPFANDGSFMEMMKKQMQQKAKANSVREAKTSKNGDR